MSEITYVPGTQNNLLVRCLGCGIKRVVAYQCSCGRKFCKNCEPQAFNQEEESDIIEVTCPDCGTKTLFV